VPFDGAAIVEVRMLALRGGVHGRVGSRSLGERNSRMQWMPAFHGRFRRAGDGGAAPGRSGAGLP
jgi:hypothetical protein